MSVNARVLGLLAVLAAPAAAAELTDFVPTSDGAMACWQRIYDARHLELHPQQEVTP